MKVSIATLFGANNVGAFLQAFSLQTVLEDIVGKDNCVFLRFASNNTEQTSRLKKAIYYLKHFKIRHMLFKYQTAKSYRNVMGKLHIDRELFSENREYDVVVVGSDEVWNLDSRSFTHYPQYFAKKLTAKNIIAYAPSAGNINMKTVLANGLDFAGFHHLSARDRNTLRIVSEVDGRTPAIVCDPTLLMESFEPYLQPVEEKNYILIYSYGASNGEIRQIKQFAKQNRKKLVSVGTYNAWCDKNIVVDPFGFLSWLKQADMVITTTFHGAVLAVKMHKQMAVYGRTSEKINGFLEQMGLENRNASKVKSLEAVFADPMNYPQIETELESLRQDSLRYLKEALAGNGI